MSNKPTYTVVRDFRGQRLYLISLFPLKGMRWATLNDKNTRPLKLSMDEALAVCEKASREWGARCAVLDAEGNLVLPPASYAIATREVQS